MAGSTHLDRRVDDPFSHVKAPTALYHPAVADAAYQLRYAWTGWPSRGYSFTPHSVLELIEQTKPHWERDSLRVLEYNLHIVLVVEQHARLESWPVLTGLRDAFMRIADRKGHAVARLSVMPTHLHAALRAEPDTAPLEIVFCCQNNLAHLLQLGRVWSTGFYVGTFGEYSMQAVRNRLAAP